jgi:hypothetical protein
MRSEIARRLEVYWHVRHVRHVRQIETRRHNTVSQSLGVRAHPGRQGEKNNGREFQLYDRFVRTGNLVIQTPEAMALD